MDRLDSIIVGVDFTPCSADALAQAARIAAAYGAKVRAVHVIETLVVDDLREVLSPLGASITEGLKEDAARAWTDFAPGVDKSGVEFVVAISNPRNEMLAQVRDARADLLVLGTHGTSPASQGTGTLATHCVRRAPTRVLLVRDGQTGPFRSIAACMDFSDTSRAAFEVALRLAAKDGAALHVIHVFNPPWRQLHYRSPTDEATADFQMQYSEALKRRLESFCGQDRPEVGWVKPQFHLVEGTNHGVGIAGFVTAQGCDLVVLGTRGRTNLRDVFLGSTAERIVRQAPCSVLTVRPPSMDEPPGPA